MATVVASPPAIARAASCTWAPAVEPAWEIWLSMPRSLQPELAGEADVDAAGQAAGHEQPVDVVERQAGVGDRQADGVGGELGRRAPVHLAGLGDAEPDDRRAAELLRGHVHRGRSP